MTCVEEKGSEDRNTDDGESGRKGDGRHSGIVLWNAGWKRLKEEVASLYSDKAAVAGRLSNSVGNSVLDNNRWNRWMNSRYSPDISNQAAATNPCPSAASGQCPQLTAMSASRCWPTWGTSIRLGRE